MTHDTSWDAPEIKAMRLSTRATNFLLQEGCRTRADVRAFLSNPAWRKYAEVAPNVGKNTVGELEALAQRPRPPQTAD